MAHVANYGERSWLILPRPFMVERGIEDPVAPDDGVAAEFEKARRTYAKFGLADRCGLEVFDGRHAINGRGTFEFLRRNLDWPAAR